MSLYNGAGSSKQQSRPPPPDLEEKKNPAAPIVRQRRARRAPLRPCASFGCRTCGREQKRATRASALLRHACKRPTGDITKTLTSSASLSYAGRPINRHTRRALGYSNWRTRPPRATATHASVYTLMVGHVPRRAGNSARYTGATVATGGVLLNPTPLFCNATLELKVRGVLLAI